MLVVEQMIRDTLAVNEACVAPMQTAAFKVIQDVL
jgi:hypothetical protein